MDVHGALTALLRAKRHVDESHADVRSVLGNTAFDRVLEWLATVDGSTLTTMKTLHAATKKSRVVVTEESSDSIIASYSRVVQLMREL